MKGAYLLIIKNPKGRKIKIGSLGKINFEKGYYIYVGSAMNSLETRIARHRQKNKNLFWHIDYLLSHTEIAKVFTKPSNKKQECEIVKTLEKIFLCVPGFGCSGCSCKSHLFFSKKNPTRKLKKALPHVG